MSRNNQGQALYVEQPHRFYRDLFAASDLDEPGEELASLLNLAVSTVNRFARPRESDEAPNGSGARSDLERFILTLKFFGVVYGPAVCQQLVNDLQQFLDDRAARAAHQSIEKAKEQSLKDLAELNLAISTGKPAEEVSRLFARQQTSTKLLLAIQRNERRER